MKDGKPVMTSFGQVQVRHGDLEIRTAQQFKDPFPLYPGETMLGKPEQFLIVAQNQALKLAAIRDFVEAGEGGAKHQAGDEWIRVGPFTYIPRVEEEISNIIDAVIIKPNTALRIRAIRDMKDTNGVARKSGEEWLIRQDRLLPPSDQRGDPRTCQR